MMEKEARTNKAGADLDKRNRNWGKVDDHMLETAEDDVHGLASMTNKAVLEERGYFKDEKTGFMLQWGVVGIPDGTGYATVTFPWAFPTQCLKIFASSNYISKDDNSMQTTMTAQRADDASKNRLSAVIYARDNSTGTIPAKYKQANWFAIGY